MGLKIKLNFYFLTLWCRKRFCDSCVRYILASLFFKSKKALVKIEKTFFIPLQKFCSFSRKTSFRFLDIQILFHQMRGHKARNTFYWITWEVNTVCEWNLARLCHITEEQNLWKNRKNCDLKASSIPFCVCKKLSTTSIGKHNFWRELLIFIYVIAKLSKFVQISMQTSSDFFLQRILWKLKRAWN